MNRASGYYWVRFKKDSRLVIAEWRNGFFLIPGSDNINAEVYFYYISSTPITPERLWTEADMIQASKYGYEYHATSQFPEMKFEEACINNTKQWLLNRSETSITPDHIGTNEDLKSETIVIRIDMETKAALQDLADADRRTLSDYLRLVIQDAIDNKKTV